MLKRVVKNGKPLISLTDTTSDLMAGPFLWPQICHELLWQIETYNCF